MAYGSPEEFHLRISFFLCIHPLEDLFKLEPCVPKTFGYSPWIQTNLKLYMSNSMEEILHFGNFIFEFLLMARDFLEFLMD